MEVVADEALDSLYPNNRPNNKTLTLIPLVIDIDVSDRDKLACYERYVLWGYVLLFLDTLGVGTCLVVCRSQHKQSYLLISV